MADRVGRRAYGRPTRSDPGRSTVVTSLPDDVYVKVQGLVEQHNISASGIVHHLVRLGLGIKPLEDL